MVGTIVCGIDASDAANPVADTARSLADGLGARLVLVHVVEEPVQEAEELLASIRERVRVTDDADVRLVEGSPAERLLEAADQDAGLLVVGSRGRGGVRSAVLGSVSRTLAMQARCPVVVVPEASDGGAGTSVVCGVDGSEHATAAARLAGELAAALGDRLLVVHALADVKAAVSYPRGSSGAPPLSAQPDARQRLAEELVERAAGAVSGVAVTRVVEPGKPWEVLEAVAERESGRLLVVAARGQSAVRATLLGSVAGQLAASARRPVVVLPEPAE